MSITAERVERKRDAKAETPHYVLVVTAQPFGIYSRSEPIRFASKAGATTVCEQLQAEFDADCDPKRAYVCDRDMVPVRAGGERRSSPREALYAA